MADSNRKPCPASSNYKRGCRCQPCVTQQAQYRRDSQRRRQERPTYRGLHDGSVSGLIVDILETHYGRWLGIPELAGEIQRIRPTAVLSDESLRRLVHRLRRMGLIQVRLSDIVTYHAGPRGETPAVTKRVEVMCPDRWYLRNKEE